MGINWWSWWSLTGFKAVTEVAFLVAFLRCPYPLERLFLASLSPRVEFSVPDPPPCFVQGPPSVAKPVEGGANRNLLWMDVLFQGLFRVSYPFLFKACLKEDAGEYGDDQWSWWSFKGIKPLKTGTMILMLSRSLQKQPCTYTVLTTCCRFLLELGRKHTPQQKFVCRTGGNPIPFKRPFQGFLSFLRLFKAFLRGSYPFLRPL